MTHSTPLPSISYLLYPAPTHCITNPASLANTYSHALHLHTGIRSVYAPLSPEPKPSSHADKLPHRDSPHARQAQRGFVMHLTRSQTSVYRVRYWNGIWRMGMR